MTDVADYLSTLLQRLPQMDSVAAEQMLSDAALKHPNDARPLLLLAAQYAHAQQMDRAEACYIEALQRAPDFAIARFQLGLLQFSSARPAAALATLAPLDQLPDGHALRLFKNAFACLAQDQLQDARTWLLQGIAGNIDNAPLNGDMQKIIRQIDLLNAPSQAAIEVPKEAPVAPPMEHHFLLSAYNKLH